MTDDLMDVDSILIVFNLPEWTSDEKFDREISLFYDEGHVWAGQIKGYKNENAISEGIFEIETPGLDIQIEEISVNPMGQYVIVRFGNKIDGFKDQIKLFQKYLKDFLDGIKSEAGIE